MNPSPPNHKCPTLSLTLTPSKNQKRRSVLFVNGVPWREVPNKRLAKQLLELQVCSIDELTKQFQKLEQAAARQHGMRHLSKRAMLSRQLANKLQAERFSKMAIGQVIADFTKQGYLNDEEFVTRTAHSQKMRGYGPRRIRLWLQKMGTPNDLAQKILKGCGGKAQLEPISGLLKTRYKARNLDDYKERRRVIASLIQRGFELSLILEALGIDSSLEE